MQKTYKKHYAYFIYDDQEYVIQFKVDEALKWDDGRYCFIDNCGHEHNLEKILCSYAFGESLQSMADKFSFVHMITRIDFIEQQIFDSVKQWRPEHKGIICFTSLKKDV